MSKKLLILSILTFVVAGGVWLYINNRVVSQPTQTSNTITTNPQEKTQLNQQEESFSPQHIMAIPGSNQVWYEIPEMGIKLLLPKEGAEELVYRYSPKKDVGIFVEMHGVESDLKMVKDVEGVSFSSKHVLEYNKTCNRPYCGTEDISFSLAKVPEKYMNETLAFGTKFLKQFPNFYLITGAPPQAVPFSTKDEEEWFYQNIGPKMPSIPPLKDIFIELLEVK